MAIQLNTFSFADVHVVIAPSGFPAYTINGEGVGEINIAYAQDNTVHDRGADGTIMPSKIKADDGTVSISALQTSPLHAYLTKLYNTLNIADSTFWASTIITLNTVHGAYQNIVCKGVSFTKRSDKPFQAQGQTVTWNLMAVSVTDLT